MRQQRLSIFSHYQPKTLKKQQKIKTKRSIRIVLYLLLTLNRYVSTGLRNHSKLRNAKLLNINVL